MMRWLAHSLRLVPVFLVVFTSGCADYFPSAMLEALTRREPTRAQAQGQDASRSDRLRGDLAYTQPEAPQPVSVQEDLQPQSLRPSESSPPRSTDEPDPRAVIDWLLKDRR